MVSKDEEAVPHINREVDDGEWDKVVAEKVIPNPIAATQVVQTTDLTEPGEIQFTVEKKKKVEN